MKKITLVFVVVTLFFVACKSDEITIYNNRIWQLPLMLITIIIFLSFKIAKKKFESLIIIIINENEIIKKQKFEKDLSISISDITEIFKDNNERLIIKGKGSMQHEMIFIPKQIENYGVIEKLLSNISSIKKN